MYSLIGSCGEVVSMKKGLLKGIVLTCVLTTMTVSTAFASVSQASSYQQQVEAIKQQNQLLMQQNEYLRQQAEALKQNQGYSQAYSQPTQVYMPAPVYVQSPVYVHTPVYNPAPWYGGLAAGYILGNWGRCGHWGCHHWR